MEEINFAQLYRQKIFWQTQFHPEKSGLTGIDLLKNLKNNIMKLKAFYGLPKRVLFCKKSLISNQRPNSVIEFTHKKSSKKKTIHFG